MFASIPVGIALAIGATLLVGLLGGALALAAALLDRLDTTDEPSPSDQNDWLLG